jgi:hypothetical protein
VPTQGHAAKRADDQLVRLGVRQGELLFDSREVLPRESEAAERYGALRTLLERRDTWPSELLGAIRGLLNGRDAPADRIEAPSQGPYRDHRRHVCRYSHRFND